MLNLKTKAAAFWLVPAYSITFRQFLVLIDSVARKLKAGLDVSAEVDQMNALNSAIRRISMSEREGLW